MANVKKITIYDAQGNPTTYNVKDNVSGYEVASNKATSLDNPSNTTYPTTKAVSDAIKVFISTINVTASTYGPITCTNGDKTYTKTGDNVEFEVISGTWTISNSDASKTITVVEPNNYYVNLAEVYGIKRYTKNTSPYWTRTDNAVGLTATASVGSTAGHSDFDNVYPYSEMERVTLSTGDVMVKIPKFYYLRTIDSSGYELIKISKDYEEGFKLHPAFDRPDGVRDYIYVGAYKTSGDIYGSNNKSVSGVSPQVNQTRATMRTNAKAKGAGWGIIDLSTLSAIQMLMMVEFANNDMQTEIGEGYTASSHESAINTGSCDNVPNLTGRPAGTSNNVDVVWRGIEGFWGNLFEFTDGLNIYNNSYYICNNPANYADDTSTNYELLSYIGIQSSGGYISQMGLDINNSYVMMPVQAIGTSTQYYTDYVHKPTTSGWAILVHSGHWRDGLEDGLFSMYAGVRSSTKDVNCGSRLQYLPPLNSNM